MATNNKSYDVAKRRERVAKAYLQGETQRAISEAEGVSLGTINGDLKYLRGQWQKNASADIDERIGQELAKLDQLEAQAWESYFKSQKVVEKGQGKRKSPPAKKGQKPKESESSFVKQIESAGDPRFLNIVENCIERRCRILGIDAPGKIELTGKDGGPIEYKDKSNMAISALAEMLKKSGVALQDPEDEPEEEKNGQRDD